MRGSNEIINTARLYPTICIPLCKHPYTGTSREFIKICHVLLFVSVSDKHTLKKQTLDLGDILHCNVQSRQRKANILNSVQAQA